MGDEDNSHVWAELRAQRDILVEVRTLLSPLADDVKDHEARLRKLEDGRIPWGKIASIATALTGFEALITWYATTH